MLIRDIQFYGKLLGLNAQVVIEEKRCWRTLCIYPSSPVEVEIGISEVQEIKLIFFPQILACRPWNILNPFS